MQVTVVTARGGAALVRIPRVPLPASRDTLRKKGSHMPSVYFDPALGDEERHRIVLRRRHRHSLLSQGTRALVSLATTSLEMPSHLMSPRTGQTVLRRAAPTRSTYPSHLLSSGIAYAFPCPSRYLVLGTHVSA